MKNLWTMKNHGIKSDVILITTRWRRRRVPIVERERHDHVLGRLEYHLVAREFSDRMLRQLDEFSQRSPATPTGRFEHGKAHVELARFASILVRLVEQAHVDLGRLEHGQTKRLHFGRVGATKLSAHARLEPVEASLAHVH